LSYRGWQGRVYRHGRVPHSYEDGGSRRLDRSVSRTAEPPFRSTAASRTLTHGIAPQSPPYWCFRREECGVTTTRRWPLFAVLAAAAFWGTSGTAASFLPVDVSPLAVGAATMGIGGILLFVVFARRSIGMLRVPAARRWIVLGAVGVFMYPLAFYSGMSLSGVAIGAVVSLGSGPVFAALIEWIVERRPLRKAWTIGTGVALIGVVLLATGTTPPASESRATDPVAGIVLALLAGAAYALYTYTSTRALRHRQDAMGTMGSTFGIGAILLLPVLLAVGSPLAQSGQTLAITAYLVLGPMFVAYVFFGLALAHVSASAATTMALAEPLVASILAVAVVGEAIDLLGWIGIVAIIVGVAVASVRGREPVLS
jgi:DME family drug/metabolite transporter